MAEIKLTLNPWVTPNNVIAYDPTSKPGEKEYLTWPISKVDALVLSDQCNIFRAEVFKKAGKKDPMMAGIR